jgi:Flp pilus assembly pilin Flp
MGTYTRMLTARVIAAIRRDDDVRGQTLVEYALLLVFIAIAVIVILTVLGPTVAGVFEEVNDAVP